MSIIVCEGCDRHVDTDVEWEEGGLCEPCSEVPEIPVGAIENGREFMRRLEQHYDFECTGGPLQNCTDWMELKRCFESLAENARGSQGAV